jgi:hypothetical protein
MGRPSPPTPTPATCDELHELRPGEAPGQTARGQPDIRWTPALQHPGRVRPSRTAHACDWPTTVTNRCSWRTWTCHGRRGNTPRTVQNIPASSPLTGDECSLSCGSGFARPIEASHDGMARPAARLSPNPELAPPECCGATATFAWEKGSGVRRLPNMIQRSPEFLSRRRFLVAAGSSIAAWGALSGCGSGENR